MLSQLLACSLSLALHNFMVPCIVSRARTKLGAQLCLFIDEWSPYCLPALAAPSPGAVAGGAEAAWACLVLLASCCSRSLLLHVGLCGAWPHHALSSWGGSMSSWPGRVLSAMVGASPAATPAWWQQHCRGLRSHCRLSLSRCPHQLLAHEMGTLLGTGWREARVRLCTIPAGLVSVGREQLFTSHRSQSIPPDATSVPRCGWQCQARPHPSRSWTQNSSQGERVSLSKVSQGWLPL